MYASRLAHLALMVAVGGCALGSSSASSTGEDAHLGQRALDAVLPTAHADQIVGSADRIADVAEQAVGAVVHIAASKHAQVNLPPGMRLFGAVPPSDALQRGAGSGVIVDSSGLILTNHHVIAGAEDLEITLSDGRRLEVEVRGDDAATDLALLQVVGAVPTDLPSLSFGDSDGLRLGEVVLAIGSPFELQGTVTMGIVSAKGRSGFPGLASYQHYIQTDAAINPGNSGGALVDLRGQLVGINTAIRSQSGGYDGISFAIPSRMAQDIMQRLLRDGRVVRGYLGVGIHDVDETVASMLQLRDRVGAVVSHVEPGSAAERAGLQLYDVILEVDGQPVDDAEQLRVNVSLKGAGSEVKLDVLREGKRKTLRATLSGLPTDEPAAVAQEEAPGSGLLSGVRLQVADPQQLRAMGLPEATQGALVAHVAQGSRAAIAGLRPGNIVLEVNRKAVRTPQDVERALQGLRDAVLLIQDGPRRRLVSLR